MSAEAPPLACAWLRARGAYGRELDGTPWTCGDSTVDGYWCLRTMEPTGPDDQLVHAHRCRPARRCFEATPAPRLDAPAQPAAGSPDRGGRRGPSSPR
ncbi:MAG TPA: hypothetical protein VFG59_07840 [Anaeromyxobacter sp.]|nr:hypothetical protein [Anaeromyxobacter sp.]